MKLTKPNFKKSVVNISATFAQFLGCPNDKPILKILQKALEKDYKNVVFIIFDGLGIHPLSTNLEEVSVLRKNIKQVLKSTFPSTTANATTSILSNKYPMEHGWFAWSVFFDELGCAVDVYLDKNSYTGESIEPNWVKNRLPFEPYYKKAVTDREISVVVPTFWHNDEVNRHEWKTFDEFFSNIEKICKRKKKQFVYCYCDEPDHTMHEYGVTSKEAMALINTLNNKFDDLQKKLDDTLFVVTADHGQVDDDGYVDVWQDEKLCSMLEKPFSFEPRATAMFVKAGKEKEFEKHFKRQYGKDFRLFKTKKMLKQNFFGLPSGENAKLLPNYFAVAITRKQMLFTKDSHRFKGHHTSLTEEEMNVPLIIIEKEKKNDGKNKQN